jgi:hypothetical protein
LNGVERAQAALRIIQLIGLGLTEGAGNSRHPHPASDRQTAIRLRRDVRQNNGFLVISRRIGIGDVIAGDSNSLLERLQR